ncbi:hypothetical protein, partial [Methylobacterium brachiatum]|uniref:hypothetical protein n=1 Tax=Methylobacterium brachiatum TaxID=269660 RepID=UPI003314BF79
TISSGLGRWAIGSVLCRLKSHTSGRTTPKGADQRGDRNGRYLHGRQTQTAMTEARRVREMIAEWREVSKLLPV